MFVVSLVGFAGASALGGLAQNSALLFGARALQGAFAAVMAPAALSLLTVAFTEPKERARAFAVYGGIAGGGAAIGLILGGVLTEFASWRWTLLINVPIAVAAAVAAFRYVSESRASANHGYDLPGAATVTGGLLALVYGFTKAGTDGWTAPTTVALFATATVLLVAFVIIDQWASHPSCPCGSSWTATGAGRSWPPCWSERRCSAPSSHSPTTSRASCTTRPSNPLRLHPLLPRHHHRRRRRQPPPPPLRATYLPC